MYKKLIPLIMKFGRREMMKGLFGLGVAAAADTIPKSAEAQGGNTPEAEKTYQQLKREVEKAQDLVTLKALKERLSVVNEPSLVDIRPRYLADLYNQICDKAASVYIAQIQLWKMTDGVASTDKTYAEIGVFFNAADDRTDERYKETLKSKIAEVVYDRFTKAIAEASGKAKLEALQAHLTQFASSELIPTKHYASLVRTLDEKMAKAQ